MPGLSQARTGSTDVWTGQKSAPEVYVVLGLLTAKRLLLL